MTQSPQLAPGFTIRDSRKSPALFRNLANRRTVYEFLSSPEVYWGQGRSQAVIDRQISTAYICFGVFKLPLPVEGQEGEISFTLQTMALFNKSFLLQMNR